jgi:hypothetical protein
MPKQTNIAQSMMNLALDVSGVDISEYDVPETTHFSSTDRSMYYITQIKKIQIGRAKKS